MSAKNAKFKRSVSSATMNRYLQRNQITTPQSAVGLLMLQSSNVSNLRCHENAFARCEWYICVVAIYSIHEDGASKIKSMPQQSAMPWITIFWNILSENNMSRNSDCNLQPLKSVANWTTKNWQNYAIDGSLYAYILILSYGFGMHLKSVKLYRTSTTSVVRWLLAEVKWYFNIWSCASWRR